MNKIKLQNNSCHIKISTLQIPIKEVMILQLQKELKLHSSSNHYRNKKLDKGLVPESGVMRSMEGESMTQEQFKVPTILKK